MSRRCLVLAVTWKQARPGELSAFCGFESSSLMIAGNRNHEMQWFSVQRNSALVSLEKSEDQVFDLPFDELVSTTGRTARMSTLRPPPSRKMRPWHLVLITLFSFIWRHLLSALSFQLRRCPCFRMMGSIQHYFVRIPKRLETNEFRFKIDLNFRNA